LRLQQPGCYAGDTSRSCGETMRRAIHRGVAILAVLATTALAEPDATDTQQTPGVYVDDIPSGTHSITSTKTAVTAFLGWAPTGPVDEPTTICDYTEYEEIFGGLSPFGTMGYAVSDFFHNGGGEAIVVRVASRSPEVSPRQLIGDRTGQTGLYALDKTDLFNLLCIPPPTRAGDTDQVVYRAALEYCVERRAMLIVDPPAAWGKSADPTTVASEGLDALGLTGPEAANAVLYYPRIIEADPLDGDRPAIFVPCGAVAGAIARTDATRGVWKAPAGTHAVLETALGLETEANDDEIAALNAQGVNCLRRLDGERIVIWGSRTLQSGDMVSGEWRYIPVRRTALFIEESIERGTRWALFEPNDEQLWARIRSNVSRFMMEEFRHGAFQGSRPQDAYFVRCDAETTTPGDVLSGELNIVIGFAPLRPVEFVIVTVRQRAAVPGD
jgi:phage tail sheath protein FI